ncbi:HD domain-containing protein [Mycobacteroides abscessus]|uniref:HD domain-containing protein n=2 Tax=Mycobacteroides abscessus TaxID=36809 RepID=UPI000C25DB5A|nr:HD domain-containing protein [Mycobacteroides abscessus]
MKSAMVVRARAVAQMHMRTTPVRWARVRVVAAAAMRVARQLDPVSRTCLLAAAWLHEVGHVESLRVTGFARLDGARFVRTCGFESTVASLVAYHSGAAHEARERGLLAELATVRRPPQKLLDALTYCDMTIGRLGSSTSAGDRLEEILRRYPPDDPMHRATLSASAELLESVTRVKTWI